MIVGALIIVAAVSYLTHREAQAARRSKLEGRDDACVTRVTAHVVDRGPILGPGLWQTLTARCPVPCRMRSTSC